MEPQEDDTDLAIDRIVNRLMEQVDATLDARLASLKVELRADLANLAGVFGPRHDDLAQRMSQIEQTFDKWAQLIRKDTTFTRLIAAQALAEAPASKPKTPHPDDPRPLQIDYATEADPDDGAQRVDLPAYGAVAYIRPGTSKQQAWAATSAAIQAGRDTGEN